MGRYDRIVEVEKRYDEIEEVKKYNHNHGWHGRFVSAAEAGASSGGGGGSSGGKFHQVTPDEFHVLISSARDSRPADDKWRVDIHTAQEYKDKGCKCITTEGGSTAAVTMAGNIISVCKKQGEPRGTGKKLMAEAVANGGKKLDSFSGNHDFYQACGFEPVCYTPFNEKYKPNGWRPGIDAKEPVIFYVYKGDKAKKIPLVEFLASGKRYVGKDGYDKCTAYRDKQIEEDEG